MAQLSGGGWGRGMNGRSVNRGGLCATNEVLGSLGCDGWTDKGMLLLLLTEKWEGCQDVKTASWELRHDESMKCTTT